MADDIVRLTMHGLASEDGHVRLVDFLRELKLLNNALRQYDRFVSSGRTSTYYRVVDLSHSSPATVALQGQPWHKGDVIQSVRVMAGFFATVEHIEEEGELPEPVDPDILNNLLQMTEPVGRSIARVELSLNGASVPLDAAFGEKLSRIMAPEQEYNGSISGMLEGINLHGGVNVFYLYPDIGPSRLVCHFPKEIEETAVAALGQFVTVNGLIRSKTKAPYPHAAKVTAIEILPPEQELPSFFDLRGIAPNATGDELAEDFIRKARNAWN